MLSVRRQVGALVEIRFQGEPSLVDVENWVVETRKVIGGVAVQMRRKVVICTDLRATQLFSQEVGQRIIDLMRGDNPHVSRNAAIGNGTALLTLQVQRLFAEAASSGRRRIFTESKELLPWLDEVLLAEEQRRLRAFLRGE